MNEIIFQPLFQNDSDKPAGYFVSMSLFGMNGFIVDFDKCPKISYTFWRDYILNDFFEVLCENAGDELSDEFDIYFKENLDIADLYIYSHKPGKPGGYVRILTEPDVNETGKLQADISEFYPDNVRNAGPVEKFLYANTDEWEQYCRLPESMRKDCGKYYWKFGDDLEFDTEVIQFYFNDEVGWNELYWDLCHAIGRPWRNSDFIEAWRQYGYDETEKKLVAEHDAQRLLFWTLENEYSLNELRQMAAEKRILTKHLTSVMGNQITLQFGL